jgi:hypothetical protein
MLGAIALGSFLNAISNSITLPDELIYVMTGSILLCWLCVEILLKIKPIKWVVADNREIVITKPGLKIRIAILGMIVLLSIPIVLKWGVIPNNNFWTIKVYDFTNIGDSADKNKIGEKFSGQILDNLLKEQFQAQKGKIYDSHFKGAGIITIRGDSGTDERKYPTPYITVYGTIQDDFNSGDYLLDLRVAAFSSDQPQKNGPSVPLLINEYHISGDEEHMKDVSKTISDKLILLIKCYPPNEDVRHNIKKCQSD